MRRLLFCGDGHGAPLKKLLVKLSWLPILFIFARLFIYDFLVSQFDLLFLREVDDYAFQVSMHSIHTDLSQFYFRTAFSKVDYGYGNFFWLTHGLLTLPAYFLNSDAFIIVAPRIFSTLLFLASIVLIYKMVLKLSESHWNAIAIAFLMSTCPVLLYASQRFHTHGLVTFLCLLSVYFCLMLEGKRKLYFATVAFGLAAGTKMTALFLAPFLAIESLAFYYFSREFKVKDLIKQIVLFLICFIFSLSPTLFSFFIYKEHSQKILTTIFNYFAHSGQNIGGSEYTDPVFLFKNGFLFFYYPLAVWTFFIIGTVFSIFRAPKEKKSFFMGILFSSWAAGLFLLFKTGQGPWAISNYYLPLGLILGLTLFYFPWKKQITTFLILLALSSQLLFQWDSIKKAIRIYPDRLSSNETQKKIEIYQFLKKEFEKNPPQKLARDYRLVVPNHPFHSKSHILDLFDNLPIYEVARPKFDYILISKENIAFLSEQEIKKFSVNEPLLRHQFLVKNLIGGSLFGTSYKKLYENEIGYVFSKTN